MFTPKKEIPVPDNAARMLQQFITLLPKNFGDIEIEKKSVLEHLQELYASRIRVPSKSDDEVLTSLLHIYNICREKEDIQSKLFFYILFGFLNNLINELKVSSSLEELLPLKVSHDPYDILLQAIFLGASIPLRDKVPEDIVDKDTYIKLMSEFRLSIDTVGPNPFGTRKTYIPDSKPIDSIQQLLKLDLTRYARDLKTEPTEGKDEKKEDEIKEDPEGIPKQIHLIWLGDELPEKYYANVASWKDQNPDYEVILHIDHKVAATISKEEKPAFLTWCASKNIRVVDIEHAAGCHPMFYFLNHEAEKRNFGAASDIGRYILNYLYGGVYFDIPDAFCKAKLPEFKSEAVCRPCKGNEEEDNYNNDFLCARKGSPILEKILKSIRENYIEGYHTLANKNQANVTTNFILNRDLRRMRTTLNLTGMNNIFFGGMSFLSAETDLFDSVNFEFAGSWVKEKKVVPTEKISKSAQIMYAITDILETLRFDPNILDLDKYPVFSDIDAVKIALHFIEKHFPILFHDVANIQAYNTRPSQEMITIALNKTLFPKLYKPFVHIVCKTVSDNMENQIYFFDQLIERDEKNLTVPDKHGNTPFLSACRQGNTELALHIAVRHKADILSQNNAGGSALDLLYGQKHQWDASSASHLLGPLDHLTELLISADKKGLMFRNFLTPIFEIRDQEKFQAAKEVIGRIVKYTKHEDVINYLEILNDMLKHQRPISVESLTEEEDDEPWEFYGKQKQKKEQNAEMQTYLEKAISALATKKSAVELTSYKSSSSSSEDKTIPESKGSAPTTPKLD